jgi:hypothetical protein
MWPTLCWPIFGWSACCRLSPPSFLPFKLSSRPRGSEKGTGLADPVRCLLSQIKKIFLLWAGQRLWYIQVFVWL